MHVQRSRRLSPAFVVAMIALFVALGGTAGAVVTAAVPLAKRALVADNSKKLGGKTAAQISARAKASALAASPAGPRPTSSAAGLVTYKATTGEIVANGGSPFTATCDAGQKAISGGFSTAELVFPLDAFPTDNGAGWTMFLVNGSETEPASVTVIATCLK